jgi:flagellar biosynthetic protein FlhB
MAQGEEQNRSEEATPYKLAKAREKGTVARGTDLGFFASLGAFLLFLSVAGGSFAAKLIVIMRSNLSNFAGLDDPHAAARLVGEDAAVATGALILFGLTLLIVVAPAEILQLRGLVFSAHPLKPDFSRLNPAKGLKRLFSLRVLKEALKGIFKLAVYTTIAVLCIRFVVERSTFEATSAGHAAALMWHSGIRLVAMFAAAALMLTAIDQVIARREFAKQMRMSRSELTREFKEREGEPRVKGKRKQLHADFLKQTSGFKKLEGSDLVLVNPEHFGVALGYDPERNSAPVVRAKARNRLALAMREQAARLNIPIIADPPLARALFHSTDPGREISADHYRAVATHYSHLRQQRQDQRS